MTISNSQEIITTIEKELISKAVIPEFGTDAVSDILCYMFRRLKVNHQSLIRRHRLN